MKGQDEAASAWIACEKERPKTEKRRRRWSTQVVGASIVTGGRLQIRRFVSSPPPPSAASRRMGQSRCFVNPVVLLPRYNGPECGSRPPALIQHDRARDTSLLNANLPGVPACLHHCFVKCPAGPKTTNEPQFHILFPSFSHLSCFVTDSKWGWGGESGVICAIYIFPMNVEGAIVLFCIWDVPCHINDCDI